MLRAALPDGEWRYERALSSVSDVTAYIVRSGEGETRVLKVAATASGTNSLRREHGILIELRADRPARTAPALILVLRPGGLHRLRMDLSAHEPAAGGRTAGNRR